MGQISQFLRSTERGVAHYCPACQQMHEFRTKPPFEPSKQWRWDGNIIAPTFEPSMHIFCIDPDGEIPTEICHYFLKGGKILYLPDCTHAMKAMSVDLPPLPAYLRDLKP